MCHLRRSLEEMAERYGLHTERAAWETLAFDSRPEQIARALATLDSGIRTLTRRRGRSVNLCLPGGVLRRLGWEPEMRVAVQPRADGVLEIRAAVEEDLPARAWAAVRRADLARAQRARDSEPNLEKHCQQCGQLFRASHSPRQRFCVACAADRNRTRALNWWRRRGKFLRRERTLQERPQATETELVPVEG